LCGQFAVSPAAMRSVRMKMASYDGSLQMFVNAPKDVDMRRLGFMRWLGEQCKLEHGTGGPSAGPFAAQPETGPTATYSAVA